MPAPLSIVIPTLNSANQLATTVACLMEGLDAGLVRELVVSDGGSGDDTLRIADDLGARLVSGTASRGEQLQRGAGVAQGGWMLFLHADTQLSGGWSDVVRAHIRSSDRAGYFRLRFRADGFRPRFFEAGANLRSRLGLPYGDQGLLISRDLYDGIGGYPDYPLMEDVAIVQKLRGKLAALDAIVLTDPARYQQNGWYRRGIFNMWTLLRFRMGADPEKLAVQYRR